MRAGRIPVHPRCPALVPLTALGLALAVGGCTGAPGSRSAAADPFNLGHHHYRITTSSPAAQAAFDRGLTLAYGFSHGAAEREFRQAAALDSNCAMAWWGVALVNGPHINFPLVPPDKARTAWDALNRARARERSASAPERALIDALAKRYANPQPDDRSGLDRAYADAMRAAWHAFPADPDIGALFAESMMDLRPWDLWTLDGRPQPGTEEIESTLERVLALDPMHPGGNHFYVHVMEASPHPEKALASADRLRDLVPGASHLVHMPAHIYARLGRWDDAVEANTRARSADSVYRARYPHPGLYAMYMAHNDHFFAYASLMEGRSAEALRAAREMTGGIPAEFVNEYAPIVDGYMAFVPEVLMRLGRWNEVLAEPEPAANLPLARAMWRQTRAVSLTALGRMREAETERAAFHRAAAAVPADGTFGNNRAADILAIAGGVLDGEMAAKHDRFDEAVALLRRAAAKEDSLRYDEPPDWMQPVRHTLGAVLLRAGRYADAEQVYREDLARYPGNGWSLFGLGRSLRLQKKDAEAGEVEARFKAVWRKADMPLGSTCFCQPGV